MLFSCARVGSPVGGKKDSLAPALMGANIDSARTNVPRDIKELRLDFDEYVKLDNISKNLIISPPIKKIKKILPSNLANKYVLIQWEDTLQANTTYNFNFGNAIKDNNEGNVLRYFNYAFSTGETIDDLYITGEIKKLINTEDSENSSSGSQKNFVVGLYKESDSVNFKEKPYYITLADPDGYFELNYLSPGNYRVLAFEDVNGNSIFDEGAESVAFLKEPVQLNKNISGLKLDMYPSKPVFKYVEMKENPGGILMLFKGKPENVTVKSLNENLQNFKVTHRPNSDSLFIWFNAKEANIGIDKSEQLRFSYDVGTKQDTVSVFYRMNQKNEMQLSNNIGNLLPPGKDFEITSNYEISSINSEKWSLTSDSLSVPFTAKISENNPFKILVNAAFAEGKKYALTVPKETVSSFFENNLKSYRFDFEADKTENFGSIAFNLANLPEQKFWIQLLNSSDKVMYSQFTNSANVKFSSVKPDTYSVRILVDNNGNGIWDSSDFMRNMFAEDIYIFSKKITARPLWEIVENWNLQTETTSNEPIPVSADTISNQQNKNSETVKKK